MNKKVIAVMFIILFPFCSHCQGKWNYEVRIGANIRFNQSIESWKQKFPAISLFVSGILTRRIEDNFQFNYGHSIAFNYKTLGTNQNPLNNDLEIDFLNSFGFGVGKNYNEDDLVFDKLLRTVNNSSAYNLIHNFENSVFISTNLILNNHKRHQVVGSFTFTYQDFSFNYYNDGGFGINFLPISDNFDRWWTAGINFLLHNDKGYNSFEFSWDQFTGYNSLLYELTSIFGFNIPKYNYESNEYITDRNYNSSAYNLRFAIDEYAHFDIGINGSLRFNIGDDGSTTYFGLQDIIHIIQKSALHPNDEPNKIHFGINYSDSIYNDRF